MSWFIWAFASAVFSSVAAVSQKRTLFSVKAFDFSLLVSLCTILFCLPFTFLFSFQVLSLKPLLILFGKTVLTALAFWLIMLSLRNMEISLALPLMILTPGTVALLAFFFARRVSELAATCRHASLAFRHLCPRTGRKK